MRRNHETVPHIYDAKLSGRPCGYVNLQPDTNDRDGCYAVSAVLRRLQNSGVLLVLLLLSCLGSACFGPPGLVQQTAYAVRHYHEVDVVELPVVASVPPGGTGVRVGLASGVDARTDPRLNAAWQVGPALAEQADARMANCVAEKGFAPVRLPPPTGQATPGRTVVVKVLSAEHLRWSIVSGPVARVELELTVSDASNQRVFSQNYVGEATGRFARYALGKTANEVVGMAVADALADAIAKGCNDPGFIAAISVPAEPVPVTSRAPISDSSLFIRKGHEIDGAVRHSIGVRIGSPSC